MLQTIKLANGQTRKLGRLAPDPNRARMRLANYITRALPPPPATQDWTTSPGAQQVLKNIYDNDRLGCCVISGIAHVCGVLQAAAGNPFHVFSDAEIIKLYSIIGGYVPGNPSTDQGCNEETALNWWKQNPAYSGGPKILGHVTVDATNPTEVRTAIHYFGNVYHGLCLPNSYIRIPGDGFLWDVDRPNPQNGHCVASFSFDQSTVGISTWGLQGRMTNRAMSAIEVNQYNGELHCIVTDEFVNKVNKVAPNGLDISAMIKDFDDFFGESIPVPPPDIPPPPPSPPSPPSPPPPGSTDWKSIILLIIKFLEQLLSSPHAGEAERLQAVQQLEELRRSLDYAPEEPDSTQLQM